MKASSTFLSVSLFAAVMAGCNQADTTPSSQTQSEQSEYDVLDDALKSGESIACTMTDTQGNTTHYWAKGEKSRAEGFQSGENQLNGVMINDGSFMYIWNEGELEGTKFSLATTQDAQQKAQEYKDDFPDITSQEARDEYEQDGYDVNCEQEQVADSQFIAPSTVTFTDMSALMQGVSETLGDTLESLPEELSPEIKEQIQKLQMQQ
jgi:hypothetical protein